MASGGGHRHRHRRGRLKGQVPWPRPEMKALLACLPASLSTTDAAAAASADGLTNRTSGQTRIRREGRESRFPHKRCFLSLSLHSLPSLTRSCHVRMFAFCIPRCLLPCSLLSLFPLQYLAIPETLHVRGRRVRSLLLV